VPHTSLSIYHLYLAEGGESKVLLVTARHVLFPMGPNVNYARTTTSMPRRSVLLLGAKAFNNLVKSIRIRIGRHGILVKNYERQIDLLHASEAGEDEDDVEEARGELKKTQRMLNDAIESIEALKKFHHEVEKNWSHPSKRILGHVVHCGNSYHSRRRCRRFH
jgi:hypothetical protein